MIPVSGAEMADLKPHIELGHRLGLFLSQQTKGSLKSVQIQYRGEVADKQTKLITSSFAAGLLSNALKQRSISSMQRYSLKNVALKFQNQNQPKLVRFPL